MYSVDMLPIATDTLDNMVSTFNFNPLELLRCFAENILTEMVRLLFSNLSLVEDTPTDNEMKVSS